MDDFLNNGSEDQQPGSDNDEKKRIDSIPLWLQGISENKADSEKSADDGEWQKEQSFVSAEETGPISIEITDQFPLEEEDQAINDPPIPEEQTQIQNNLANWFKETEPVEEIAEEAIEENETAEEVSTTTNSYPEEAALEETDETTEEVLVEIPEVEDLTSDSPAEALTPETTLEQDFLEPTLSEWEEGLAEPIQDEILSETEEIPDWLRDMIAADEKQQRQEQQRAALSDEPTQPVVVQSEPNFQAQVTEETEETIKTVEEEEEIPSLPEESNPPSEDETAAAEFNAHSTVMPTANWSRITGISNDELAAQQAENEPNSASDDGGPNFEGTGFQPIQFEPVTMENEDVQDEPDLVEDDEIETFQDEISETYPPSWPGEAQQEATDETEPSEEEEEEEEEEETVVPENWGPPAPSEDLETTLPVHTFSATEIVLEEPEPDSLPVEMINGVPASLFQAKQILEQGEISQAMKVIKTYINRSEYLDEIKAWLISVDEKIEKNKASLWEALGDISSHQGDYSAALASYAKAIELLELARHKSL